MRRLLILSVLAMLMVSTVGCGRWRCGQRRARFWNRCGEAVQSPACGIPQYTTTSVPACGCPTDNIYTEPLEILPPRPAN